MAGPKDTLDRIPTEAELQLELERNLREREILRSLLKLTDDCRIVLNLCKPMRRKGEVSHD
jgi:hypothetical protein